MAPDKIYLKEFDGGISQMWSSIKAKMTIANAQYEYIRKDALLEWAEAKKSELFNGEPTDVAAGINAGIDMIIKKLKSL